MVLVTGLPLSSVQAAIWRLTAVVTGVSVFGLLTVAVLGGLIVRRTLRPLNRVAQVASGVTELPLHQGQTDLPVRVPEADTDPATEVGQVGAALNTLLGHVDSALQARNAADARMRRFVADASHELRTPLASIRGYAELTRRTRAEVPPEVAHALSRVESEAIRMSGLVEELLLLARLDGGREIEREPVDLTDLLVNTISDAHAAGPEHRWQLDLPEVPVVATGDESQLHQVVVNLLGNARVHTPPGTTVKAALRLLTDQHGRPEALFTVTDNGPGIAPDLLPEVFERFARGDNSRSRTAGSTGLGLSIVSAVVSAHGGTVDVTSQPGRTCFSVRLPAEPPEELFEPEDASADVYESAPPL
nr:HAMP domain-containing sensor histidine kinase [Kineosporia babensis]